MSQAASMTAGSVFQQINTGGVEESKGGQGKDEQKRMIEMAKIRQNELALAQLTKKQHNMKIQTRITDQ